MSILPAISLALIATLAFVFADFAVRGAHTRVELAKTQILRAALIQAQTDALSSVNAQMATTYNPDAAIPLIDQTHPACGPPIAGLQSTFGLCTGTMIHEVLSWQNPQGTGTSETLANVNRSTDMNGMPIESYASFAVSIDLLSGARTLAHRGGTLRVRIVDQPPTYASLDGFIDANGDRTGGAAEGGAGARCDPSQPGCSNVALTAATPAAVPDDARVFGELMCQDTRAGTPGHPGDLCNPTGDATPTPVATNDWTNRQAANGDANGGWTR